MSNTKSSNQAAVPEAKGALDRFKFEVANELGVPLTDGYNGNLTSKQNGSVGGYMVKKIVSEQPEIPTQRLYIRLSCQGRNVLILSDAVFADPCTQKHSVGFICLLFFAIYIQSPAIAVGNRKYYFFIFLQIYTAGNISSILL